jgi:hypothetical protein
VTRDCHVDDCGKNHPCLVPFVVHAIFGFAAGEGGAEDRFWDKPHEEVFANALSEAILQERTNDSLHVGPGDISIILVRDWREGSGIGGNGPIGKKVTAEISIYNSEAAKQQKEGTFHQGCREEALYPYSQAALEVHNMMLDDNFLQTVLDITVDAGNMHADHSSFDVEYLSKPFNVISAKESKILSSWTIKTEGVSSDNYSILESSKFLLTDPAALAFAFAVILFILSCGIFFGYRIDQRRDEEIQQSILERIRVQTTGRRYVTTSKGNYAKISVDDENTHNEDGDDEDHDHDDHLHEEGMPTSFARPYKDNDASTNNGNGGAGGDIPAFASANNGGSGSSRVDEEYMDHDDDDEDDDSLGDIEFA